MTYASIMIGLKVAVIQGNKKKDIKDTTTKKYYELIVYQSYILDPYILEHN